MMNIMYNTTGSSFGFGMLWGLHILSIITFFTGVVFLLYWAFKHLTPAQLKRWGWTLIIVGTIVCLFTIGVMGHPWGDYGIGGFGYGRMMPMMQWGNGAETSDSKTQSKEEVDGKALYDKLQAKQATCADLTDSDFELIGEYFMGQRLGAGHEQINQMMQRMMGQEGEEQMHVLMGKRLTGCFTNSH